MGSSICCIPGPLVDGGNVQVNPTNPNIVYAAQDGNLMQSTDGGHTWTSILTVPFTNNFAFQIDKVNPSQAWSWAGFSRERPCKNLPITAPTSPT